MRVIDAHHHIWRRADLPWLLGPSQPRIFGAYDAIKRDYPIEEYLRDISGTDVAKSVYVQANWPPNWFMDEVRFVEAAHQRTGWPHAIVAFADMRQDDARADLDRLAIAPLVRGVRHQMHWHPNPAHRFAPGPDAVASDTVIENCRRLADYGFVFELQVFERQAEPALRLVRACPDVTFVLQHAMMPDDLSDEGLKRWRGALDQLAAAPNVVCKLSGFGTFLRRNDPIHIAYAVKTAVTMFGSERCLFGSNFPIEKIWTDYAALLRAFTDAADELSKEERKNVFKNTAAKIYRL